MPTKINSDAKKIKRKPLTRSRVFVRIRPVTETGDCAHTSLGEGQVASDKVLQSWTEHTVRVQDNGRRAQRDFQLSGVIPPEMKQQDTFDSIMPPLIEGFHTDNNVMFFAYGQTGSGKTHTSMYQIYCMLTFPLVSDLYIAMYVYLY